MIVGANFVVEGIAICSWWDRAESPILVVALLVECLDACPICAMRNSLISSWCQSYGTPLRVYCLDFAAAASVGVKLDESCQHCLLFVNCLFTPPPACKGRGFDIGIPLSQVGYDMAGLVICIEESSSEFCWGGNPQCGPINLWERGRLHIDRRFDPNGIFSSSKRQQSNLFD